MRVWVTKTVLGATSRKTEIVFRSSSVRVPELREVRADGGGIGGSALDVGDGGGDVDRHARTAESPKSAARIGLLGWALRHGFALSVSISRAYRVPVRFYSSNRRTIDTRNRKGELQGTGMTPPDLLTRFKAELIRSF